MVRQAVVREVVEHYQGLVRLRDTDIRLRFVGRIPGSERTYMEVHNDGENQHRYRIDVARCAQYLPADLLIEKVCHELAHVLLWPLGAEEEAEHRVVDKLAIVWAETLPPPFVLQTVLQPVRAASVRSR